MTLPEGWAEGRFAEAVTVVRGVTFSKEQRADVPTKGHVPCLRSGNVQDKLTTEKLIYVPAEVVKSPDRYIRDGDAIVSMSNSYELVGKVARADARHEGMTFGAFLSSFRSDIFDSGYVFNLLRSPSIQSALRATASQTVNISNLSIGGMADIVLPIAPAAEQRRIVAKLDALTARLARARAELDRVPVLTSRLKQEARRRAFANGGTRYKLSEITPPDAAIIYGILQPGPTIGGGVPYVRPSEIDAGVIQLAEVRRTTPEIAAQYRRSTIRTGDLILTIVGTIGKVAEVPAALDGGNITQSSCRVRVDGRIADRGFIRHWLQSPQAWEHYDAGRLGTAVPRLNLRDIREFTIDLPDIDTQRRIAVELDTAFACSDRLEAEAARARELIDRLQAAILARAFRGELVPQNPDDEPASVLLDRTRAQRAAAPKPKRGRRK